MHVEPVLILFTVEFGLAEFLEVCRRSARTDCDGVPSDYAAWWSHKPTWMLSAPMITTKRVYEPYARTDGYRVLVDRLWPRGLSKANAHVDLWAKDIAPSTELRQWYEHDPDKWPEFQKRYRDELKTREAQAVLSGLARRARGGRVTLVYSSQAGGISNAAALERMLKRRVAAARARRG